MNTAGGRSASCRSRALMMDIVTVSASPLSGVLYSSAAAVSSATARTACSVYSFFKLLRCILYKLIN